MLIFDVSVIWQHPHEAKQRILLSPKRTERGFLEEPAGESERNSSPWAGFDQLVDDQSHQLVDLDDWMWHGWRKGLEGLSGLSGLPLSWKSIHISFFLK